MKQIACLFFVVFMACSPARAQEIDALQKKYLLIYKQIASRSTVLSEKKRYIELCSYNILEMQQAISDKQLAKSSAISKEEREKIEAAILKMLESSASSKKTLKDLQDQMKKAEEALAESQRKAEQINASIAALEKEFLAGLKEIPTDLPLEPSSANFDPNELFPVFYQSKVTTYYQIARQMKTCIANETGIKAPIGYFRYGDGIAVVVYPHPVDALGNTIDSAYEDHIKYADTWSWGSIFGGLTTRKKGYSRIMIFLFSENVDLLNPPSGMRYSGNLDQSLTSAGFSSNLFQLQNINKKPGCKVVTYMFEHIDVDPEHPKLIKTVPASEHLVRSNLLLHLTKYH